MDSPAAGSYWYVEMAGASNFAVDDQNYEKLKAALTDGRRAVEIVDLHDATILVNTARVAHIDESTPASRDKSYLWNKQIDEDEADRKKRLGAPAPDFD